MRIQGTIEGTLHLGHHYGVWTVAPTLVFIGRDAKFNIDGEAYCYGDNIIRVEQGAALSIGHNIRINTQTNLNVKDKVVIGSTCLISQGVHIRDNDGPYVRT